MLNLLYGPIGLDYQGACSLLNTDQEKKAILSPHPVTNRDGYDIIDDCYTYNTFEKQIKSLLDLGYTAIVAVSFDTMLLNSGIKKEFEIITELKTMLTRFCLAAQHKYKAEITLIASEKPLIQINKKNGHLAQLIKYIPNLYSDLYGVIESYSNNCWRLYVSPLDSKQYIQKTPTAECQAFSIMETTDQPAPSEPVQEPAEQASTEDIQSTEITWEGDGMRLYKLPENFFEVATDARWLFDQVKSKAIPIDQLTDRVAKSKKMPKDKIEKALSYLSSLNKLFNG